MTQSSADFSAQLWANFTARRPEPDDPALRYGGAGHSEDRLRHFTGTPFYQALLPETQNILRHIRRVEWLRPPQVDALELYIYLKEVRGNPTTQQLYHDVLLADPGAELTVLPGSAYNVIVSNVQKIILRRYSRPSAARTLFGDTRRAEAELVSNARLQRLQELDNLAVFVDEAHHSFGRSLEGDLKRARETINHLHVKPDDEIRRGEIHDIFQRPHGNRTRGEIPL